MHELKACALAFAAPPHPANNGLCFNLLRIFETKLKQDLLTIFQHKKVQRPKAE